MIRAARLLILFACLAYVGAHVAPSLAGALHYGLFDGLAASIGNALNR